MNSTIKDIIERRSVRKFRPEQINDEELKTILECGTWAASGGNRQTAIIVAVQNEEYIKKMSAMNAAVMGADTDPFYGAPTVVVVLADRSAGNRVADGSLVLGNMMLAAHALGIGSCWINRAREVFNTDEGKALLKEFGVEGDYEGVGNLILGYPDGDLPAPSPRKENYITLVK